MPAPTTTTQPPKKPAQEGLYKNEAIKEDGRSQELTGGAIRAIEARDNQAIFHITRRAMHTGIGSPVTSETLMGAATKALTKAGIKHTTGQDPLDPSFIGTVKLDAANLDIIAAARVMLEGIAKHLEEKRVSPKQGAKDHPERFREEAVQIATDPKIAEFLQRPEIAPKVGKGTLDELKKAAEPEKTDPTPEAKPPVKERVGREALKHATGIEMRLDSGRGAYTAVMQTMDDANAVKDRLSSKMPKGSVSVEYFGATESGTMRRSTGGRIMVDADAMTQDAVDSLRKSNPCRQAIAQVHQTWKGL